MNLSSPLINNRLFFKLFYALVLSAILLYGFKDALIELYDRLHGEERYSHGFIIPFVVIYLIYQKRLLIKQEKFNSNWIGFLIVLLAILIFIIGKLSALWTVVQYALFFIVIGLLLSYTGWQALKIIIVPLLLLLLSIPLPYFIDVMLSGKFQLISSELGVDLIRFCEIPVFLEGNVIDLGVYKLQVIEACSGLNYLYPLMSIGVILAYMYNDSAWKRIFIFLSTIPITIFMNSFRIAVVALLVDNYGISMAEGALHDFEGWMIYMVCIGVLLIEIKLLSKRSLSEVLFNHDVVINTDKNMDYNCKINSPWPLALSSALIVFSVILVSALSHENEIIPTRNSFHLFPTVLNGKWNGTREYFRNNEQSILKVTDYLLIDYLIDGKNTNLYIGYHESQRNGTAPHSPRACIPGSGWEIASIESLPLEDYDKSQFYTNRLIIQKGEIKQLVYYWFQQRGRKIDNEFVMKWYLFKDALFLNRTDGALVRITTPVAPNENIAVADNRLKAFAQQITPVLPKFIPD
jgi:exosortase D (VPLPA-CTERM-specific)